MIRVLIAMALACAAGAPGYAQAKIDVAAIRATAEGSASQFAELRTMLRDPDVNLRLATFDAMVANGDPSLYEIAVSTAIADSDEVIRSRALWEIMSRMATIIVLVDPDGTIEDAEAKKTLRDLYQGRMSFATVNAVKPRNCINMNRADDGACDVNYNLTLNGTRVSFVHANELLDGELLLEGDGVLRGTLRQRRAKIEFPVAIPLR